MKVQVVVVVVLPLVQLVLAASLTQHSRYHGSQVLRVVPEAEWQVHQLITLQQREHYDFWREPRALGSPVDIMSPAFHLPALKAALQHLGLNPSIRVSNVADLIQKQPRANTQEQAGMNWENYHQYDTIMAWLDTLAANYSSLCRVEEVGRSYENRTMKLLTVGTGPDTNPGIFIDGGIHAREWISPATVTYIINELVTNGDKYSDLLAGVNFYFMPVINPDGYDYTWSDERFWRKTRSDVNSLSGCKGVDPNRNWDHHWMEAGASNFSCSQIYAGPSPFSEVEMQVVRDEIAKRASTLKSYLTFHSFTQLWIYPWAYTEALPDDWLDLDNLAKDGVAALTAVHNTTYTVGSIANVIYSAAGSSLDWAKGVAGVKYSYCLELRDTGEYGFLLPADQIIPTGEETFAGFKVLADHVNKSIL